MKFISTLEVQNIYDMIHQKIKKDFILDHKNVNNNYNKYLFNFLQKNIIVKK